MGRIRIQIAIFFAAAAIPAILSGCAGFGPPPARYLVAFGLDPDSRPAYFNVCRNIGCGNTARVHLDESEWRQVRDLFAPPPADAREERARASRAVGLLEEMVGPKAGTQFDAARNDYGPPDTGQLDCVAEAGNATVYLLMLERDGMLPRHRVRDPARRGFLFFFPHRTAVLVERGSGRAWAVDSWYGPNGSPASVWPLETWLDRKNNEKNREDLVTD